MSVELKLDASLRKEQGSGASRRLRRAKQVPAILYGAHKEATPLVLDEEQVLRLMRSEAFFSQIIDIRMKGRKTEQVILKDLQRHAFKPRVVHMDLQRIVADEALRVRVPVHFLNEEAASGVKNEGGVIHHDLMEVEIECLPKDLPEYLEVDIEELALGESIHLSQVPLPGGVTIPALDQDADHDQAVVSIHAPRVMEEPEEEEEAPEVAAGEEPAAGEDLGESDAGEQGDAERDQS